MQKRFEGVNVNLQALAVQLFQWFSFKGYQSQYFGAGNYYIVQAKKEGLLRHLFAADRAFTVKLFGGPGFLEVNTGVANWVKAEDVTEAFLADLVLGPIGLLVEAGEGLWNLEIEHEVMKQIEDLINSGAVTQGYYQPYYQQPQMYQPMGYYQQAGYYQQKVCRVCGFPNPPNARFCSNCGNPLY
jgi:hypothetical protein